MLNKDNYVPWSSRIIRYARSRPNGKMIVDSIENGPYVRRMISTLGEQDLPVPVPESFNEQIDEELTENDIKWIDADDQAIQTILLGLPEDIYAAVDSCETAKEIWERVRQMMKGSDIGDGESIESYYYRFMQLMNDLKRNKHFPENIAANLKFLNNLQPEWKRHVTIVRQTMNLHEANFTQIYDFLKMNQNEAFQLTAPTNNNQRTLSNPCNRQIAQLVMNMIQDRQTQNVGGNGGNQFGQYAGQVAHNQQGYNAWQNGLRVLEMGIKPVATTTEDWVILLGISLPYQGEGMLPIFRLRCSLLKKKKQEFNFKQKNLTSWLLQEEQYTDLLDPVPKPQLVPQNDNHVTSVALSMVQSGGTVETSSAPNKETRAHQETVYRNLVDQVAQEKYDKLEKCYQKSVYQEQCLTRKINALHLSSAKHITTLNGEISNLNKQLSKENSSISSLMEEKKRLKHDFKTQEDKFLDKEVDLENKIKDLENILLKKDQTVQTMHMFNPKPNSFYHPDQKMALCYSNPSYLKQAQLKQQSLYNGNMLLEEHDPPTVYDSEETLKLAQEIREKMRFLKKEINWPINTSESMNNTLETSVTPHVDKPKLSVVTPHSKKLHASIPSHS
nr:hypothetical protein [Tanacetum cinerariifolium]